MTFSSIDVNFPAKLTSRTFTDIDEVASMMSLHRPTQLNPLSLDPFCVNITQADFGPLLFFFADLKTPVHHTGERRRGFIQFATTQGTMPPLGFVQKQPLDTNTLASFDQSRETNSIWRANVQVFDIHIQQDLFAATCQAMRRDDLDAHFLRRDCLSLPTTLRLYQAYLWDLLELIKTRSPLLQTPEYRHMILGDLLPILIDAIPRQKATSLPAPAPNTRAMLAHRARDFIHAHLDQPLTLKDIYQALGVSRRTLYYSFESIFEMSPIGYLKLQRLQGVRRSLQQADPTTSSVAKIAPQWGFWSLSHFAQDYQAQFGELPSETLRQAPANCKIVDF